MPRKREGLVKRGGRLGQFTDLKKGGLVRKRGWCFLRGGMGGGGLLAPQIQHYHDEDA